MTSSTALRSSGGSFDLDTKQRRLTELEARQSDPAFWNEQNAAKTAVQEVKQLKGWLGPYADIQGRLVATREMAEMLASEPDAGLQGELEREAEALTVALEEYELKAMLRGPDDAGNALITIHPGAGGTESQDWAEMIMRMYDRWAKRHGFDVAVLDLQPGEEAGIKSATMEIKGQYAYGFLKAEKGVHRLVRISPFDSQARRHTSFASLFVYPDIDDTIEVDLRDEDIRMDVFRASGAGGQHVNKTSSAVRLTHAPSGIVVSCQSERSQHRNKESAMKILKARLYVKQRDEEQKRMDKLIDQQKDIAWGSQIRSYVFQPYTMVKDHRTDHQTSDVHKVMDGELTPFIDSWLRRR